MATSLRLAHVPVLLAAPVLLAGPLISACRDVPTPAASSRSIDQLQRVEYTVDVGQADLRIVSTLRSAAGGVASKRALVIYIHGTPGAAEGWADYLIDPVAGARSIAVDRPGFGLSDARSLATLEGQARALAPLIESSERVILVGHSYGGPVALQAAIDWPERVRGVVVIGGSVSPEHETRRWFNYAARAMGLILPHGLRRANQEVWPLKADLERLARVLPLIRAPVAVVHGTQDTLVPYGNVAFLERSLTRVSRLDVHTLDGAGHFVVWQPDQVPGIRATIAELVDHAEHVTDASEATTRSAAARSRARASRR